MKNHVVFQAIGVVIGLSVDGTVVPGKTCNDWTSEDATLFYCFAAD